MQFEILTTDTLYFDSPNCGDECICSRCGKAIYNIALRFYPPNSNTEYRYHFACQGIKTDQNDFEPYPDDDFEYYENPFVE